MPAADRLAESPAERACLQALRDAAGSVDGVMERHCVRQFRVAEELAARGGIDVDRELLLCAAFMHDAGLFASAETGHVYIHDSRLLAERALAPFGWDASRLARCLDAIEQHHSPRSRRSWGSEVELTRRADLVEVSAGWVRFGLPRAWLRDLVGELPRTGLYRLIVRSLLRATLHNIRAVPGIFLPPREPTKFR